MDDEAVRTVVIAGERVTGRPYVLRQLRDPDSIGEMMRADVIWLTDPRNPAFRSCIWGKEFLKRIISPRQTRKARVYTIEVYFETGELEVALAACTVAKGSHEYPNVTPASVR